MPDRATRVLRDARDRPWARVYVDRGGYGQLAVRVHGLMMFRRWMHADDDVVVELIPARSREVLSASRDSLRDEYAEGIDRFVADLIRNRSRALRPPTAPLNLRINGGGFLRTDSRRLTDAEITAPAPAVEAADQAGQETEPVATEPVAADGAATVVAIQPANAAALHNIRAVAAAGARRPGPSGVLGHRRDRQMTWVSTCICSPTRTTPGCAGWPGRGTRTTGSPAPTAGAGSCCSRGRPPSRRRWTR
jgi:hypothetical protein